MPTQEVIALNLEHREVTGKAVKQLRNHGMIPAVIHDHGKESVIVMGTTVDMLKAYKAAGKNHPVELKIGKKLYTALIKTAEFDPKKHLLQHVVFNAVNADQEVEAEVPVHVVGEIPAEKTGLMVLTQLDHVEVESLPKDLPNELTVDGTKLVEIGDRLTVADIVVPAGVKILTDIEHPVASVEETKAQVSEEEEVAEDEEGAETAEGEEKADGEEKSEESADSKS